MVDLIRCGLCSKDLPPEAFPPSARKRGAYCRTCNAEYQRAHYWERQAKSWPRTCRGCGQPFDKWSTWVGRGVHNARCKPCYDEYTRQRQNPVGTRRTAFDPTVFRFKADGRPIGKAWDMLRQSVIDEASTCGICGEPVDKSIRGWASEAPAVDHIIPIALGGHATDRSNLRLVHFGCNSRQGTTLQGPERIKVLLLAVELARAGL